MHRRREDEPVAIRRMTIHNCTAAELDPEIKNAESHRGQALRELLKKIEAL